AKARAGAYPENIQGDVSPERLRRFFTKIDSGYRISKSIRDMCIFAQHNLLNDPPFSQMDIICCRNLLIYLEPVLQSKAISLFHYSAKPNGYLILGTSEGVGAAVNLFSTVERAHKIFQKRGAAARQVVTFSLNPHTERAEYVPLRMPTKPPDSAWNYLEAQKEFDRRLLAQHVPAAAFINDDMEIMHTRGNVSRYLKLAPGRASLNIVKMAREGLLYDLRNAILRAKKENKPVRKETLQIKNGNGNGKANGEDSQEGARPTTLVNLDVIPVRIGNLNESYFMVLFQDAPVETVQKTTKRRRSKTLAESLREASRITKLEEELTATKEYLHSVIETQEATNEELQSANDELRSRNLEITQVNNALTKLLSSIYIAVVMVGSDLTIRRFTPRAEKVIGLIPADMGRPLLNINPNVEIGDLQQMLVSVISSNRFAERDVTDRNGTHYRLRILPARMSDGASDGAVITLVEIPAK